MVGIVTAGGDYTVHLTYKPNGLDEGTDWAIACMPGITNFRTQAHHPNYLRSNDTRAVTCPKCKNTNIYKEVQKTERP